MNERLVALPIVGDYPGASAALGAAFSYVYMPFNGTIVYVTAGASADNDELTLDINDDGSGAVTAIDISDKDAPGEWQSTGMGGSETPVYVAAGSKISFDANNADNAVTILGYMLVLSGEVTG